jgi:heme exporter protein D
MMILSIIGCIVIAFFFIKGVVAAFTKKANNDTLEQLIINLQKQLEQHKELLEKLLQEKPKQLESKQEEG